jgi:cell division protein FtsL
MTIIKKTWIDIDRMTNKNNIKISNNAPSLLKVLLLDIFVNHWIVTTLAGLFVASAMLLAHTTHDSRKLTAQLQALRQLNETEQLTTGSLRLEISSLSEANRISSLAKSQLGMVNVDIRNEKVISL